MSVPIAQFSTPPSPPHRGFPHLVSIHLFSTSVSQLLPCKPVHLYHFSRFHIHALIYDICFSLSDLLDSVWQSLDPSTSQQMTQFRSFLWLSNIPLYICTTTSLSIRLSMGNQTPWLQTILQSYSNQDNMVLAQKQKDRSVEQDRKPRDKPTHLWSTNLWQR